MRQIQLVEEGRVECQEVDLPVPKEKEVLIRINNVGVCGTDISAYHGMHPYIRPPIVLGHEFSGTITALGDKVKSLRQGMRVTVLPHLGCGECVPCKERRYNHCEKLKCIGCQSPGAFAQYLAVPDYTVFQLPGSISFEQGAMVEPASVGYHGMMKGMPRGSNVVIVGAGPIGIFALQAARTLGAKKVAIADIKAERLSLAKALTEFPVMNLAEATLDDAVDRVFGGSKNVDLYCDCVGGDGRAIESIIRTARRGSRIVCIGILRKENEIPHLPDIVEHELAITGSSMYVPKDFSDVLTLMSKGMISTKGLITHRFRLEEIPEMYRKIESNQMPYLKIMIDVE
jgi:L-iditol 2-dehydrogenase